MQHTSFSDLPVPFPDSSTRFSLLALASASKLAVAVLACVVFSTLLALVELALALASALSSDVPRLRGCCPRKPREHDVPCQHVHVETTGVRYEATQGDGLLAALRNRHFQRFSCGLDQGVMRVVHEAEVLQVFSGIGFAAHDQVTEGSSAPCSIC